MRVLALAPYPETAPSTRFRLAQFRPALRDAGIQLEIEPFVKPDDLHEIYRGTSLARRVSLTLRGLARRLSVLSRRESPDLFIVHREISPVLGGVLLGRLRATGVPYLFDFDDPVYLPPRGGDPLLRLMRRPRRTTRLLCRDAAGVLAGNLVLAEFARGVRSESADDSTVGVLPTVIDTERFQPPSGKAEELGGPEVPVVGWVGSHTTLPELVSLFPVLRRARQRAPFRLRVVCNRRPPDDPELEPEFIRWSRETEVQVVQGLDVGLYPLADTDWNRGKCGFKAIQYLACGVPTVASPVGVLPEIVVHGDSGLLASESDEWVNALERLIVNPPLRRKLGRRGRERVVSRYSVRAVVGELERALVEAAGGRRS